MSADYLLHESSVGYAIFQVKLQSDTVGARLKEVQDAHTDLAKFGKTVSLAAFAPFQGAGQALENANDVSEGIMSDYLQTVVESNIPKASKKSKKPIVLGVGDKGLAGSLKAAFPGLECETRRPVNWWATFYEACVCMQRSSSRTCNKVTSPALSLVWVTPIPARG